MATATKTSSGPLVRAVYARLRAQITTINGLAVGVYGDVPQGAALPYLTIESMGTAWNTAGRAGEEAILSLHAYGGNGRTVDAMVDAAVAALNGYGGLAVEGYIVFDRPLFETTERGEDVVINNVLVLHRIPRFRVWLVEQ